MSKTKTRKKSAKTKPTPPEVTRGILSVVFFTLTSFSLLAFLERAGEGGILFTRFSEILLGSLRFALPFLFLFFAFVFLFEKALKDKILPLILALLALLGLLHLRFPLEPDSLYLSQGGGYIGFLLSIMFRNIIGFTATFVIFTALLISSFLLFFRIPLKILIQALPKLFSKIKNLCQQLKQKSAEAAQKLPLTRRELTKKTAGENDERGPALASSSGPSPKASYATGPALGGVAERAVPPWRDEGEGNQRSRSPRHGPSETPYELPLSLLQDQQETPVSGDVEATKNRIQRTLENFGISVEMDEVDVGPTVTRYTLKPAEGIKLARITALSQDLALALAAHPIRIEAPIPGKSLVGIEVPNHSVARVSLKEILNSKEWVERSSNLALGLGRDVAGNIFLADIKKMPHLLLAGSTGSGKTVALNSIIASLLFANSPTMCRLLLVDPKRVEFPIYNGIPHLIAPVITDAKKTIQALRFAIDEMDRRFELFEKQGARDIASFNQGKGPEEILPYLIIFIDELADLMAVAASEVEGAIIRLAQMARATGIHLIVATQRPSVDVITGLIKANITSRIAFSVASAVDSRTIMDTAGAEKLLGRGDMLFLSPEISKPKRVQGAFLKEEEIKNIVDYLKKNVPPPPPLRKPLLEEKTSPEISLDDYQSGLAPEDDEELYEVAKKVIIESKKASATLLQRRLKIGYARAARILDLLEERSVIGPADGAKPREILVKNEINE